MAGRACAVCNDPAELGAERCHVCSDYLAINHAVDVRESELERRLAKLGWSATWHGPYDQRWAQLDRGSLMHPCARLCVTLSGRVLGGVEIYGASKASVADINRWFRELREAFYER